MGLSSCYNEGNTMKKTAFEGVWTPREVFEDNNLNLQQKLIYSMICNLSSDEPCFAGNKYFAKILNMSTRRVSAHISHLRKNRYIKHTMERLHDGTVSKRTLTPCHSSLSSRGLDKNVHKSTEESPVDKNVQYIINDNTKEDNKSVKDELNKPIKKTIKDKEIDSIYNLLINIYPKKGRASKRTLIKHIKKVIADGLSKDELIKAAEDWRDYSTFHYNLDNWFKEEAYKKKHYQYPDTTFVNHPGFRLRDIEYYKG